MDPLTLGIISGLIVNSITSIFSHIAYKGRKLFNYKEDLKNSLEKDNSLETILQKALTTIAKSTNFDSKHLTEELRLFFVSPDAEAIVRQIYASQLTQSKNIHLKSLRNEFLSSLSLWLNKPGMELEGLASQLFDLLLNGCERALEISVEKGILSAHEAKSSSRHILILDELQTIKKNLAILTARDKPSLHEIIEFENKYRQQVGDRHAHITPPHFDASRKLPIDDLYVPSDFEKISRKKDENISLLNLQDFLSLIHRAVIIGNPGAGKSTFTFKLCHDLATRYSERIFTGRQITPILVILREYGAEKKAKNCSILQFIEITANSTYQVQPLPGTFEYLLLNGRVIVIFDGLDELLDTSYRQEISGDIESFCNLYPSVPVLVTSRKVGYEQAPLDEKRFEVYQLSEFNEKQVEEYALKWFSADTDLTHEQQKQKTSTFLEESHIVTDLRSNPLMLALMCNIYRGENYIPKNRPDVYEKCAVMLFERWDKSRGINVQLPFESHIRPAMMYLAHWIYENEELQGGVTERDLITKATEYLCPRRFEDRDDAESASREFIEFCRGRAWVFTDTGTKREGECLYQFTHRTFLEYFTAAHLTRTNSTPDKLGEILEKRISKREWDVVAQLAFQLQNKNVEGAGDVLLTTLINNSNKYKRKENLNIMSFSTRCLEFMIPSPKVTRTISATCIRHCFTMYHKHSERGKLHKRHFRTFTHFGGETVEPISILSELLNASSENREVIANELKGLLAEKIISDNIKESLLAFEIGMHLKRILSSASMWRGLNLEALDFCERISDRIFNACSIQIIELCKKYFEPCFDSVWRGKVSTSDLIKWHGIKSLFHKSSYIMFGTSHSSLVESLFFYLMNDLLLDTRIKERTIFFRILEETGHILTNVPPPWASAKQVYTRDLRNYTKHAYFIEKKSPSKLLELSPDAIFSAFIVNAMFLESLNSKKEILLKNDENQPSLVINPIRLILLSRFTQVSKDKVQEEMDRHGFTIEQQKFAWRWIKREVDFVRVDTRVTKAKKLLKFWKHDT